MSAHASPNERKPALRSAMAASVFNRSRGGSGQPVEPRHHQYVVGFKRGQRLAQLSAVGLRAACRLAEHLLASDLGELARLRLDAPTVRRYPRIAEIMICPG